jgi:hypothetical protein
MVSEHYHRTRTTAFMRAKRRSGTVGRDNTGVGMKSQMVGMNLIPNIAIADAEYLAFSCGS